MDKEDYQYKLRQDERKRKSEEEKLVILDYSSDELSGERKQIEKDKFMENKIKSMEIKSNNRILNGKLQIERLLASKRKSTDVQVRNLYEANIIHDYAISNGASGYIFKSGTLTGNKVKKITIRLKDYESNCAPSECPCARNSVTVQNEDIPIYYVEISKNI